MALAAAGSAVTTALVLSQTGLLGLHFQLELGQPGTASGALACVTVILDWVPRWFQGSYCPWTLVEPMAHSI